MVKVDLITGFLGSGKTTFIRNYVKYLVSKGERIGILENDFGAINVDMMLLSDLRSENVEIEMIAGGCDYDCHVRRFKTKLISMAMSGYTRVIVEPSGIFDTDEFFDLIYDEPLDSWYQMGSVITLVDANAKLIDINSKYLFASQLASCGIALVSHSINHNKEELITLLNDSMKEIGCNRVFGEDVILMEYSNLGDTEMDLISKAGYHTYSYQKRRVIDNNEYSSLYFMNEKLKEEEIRKISSILFRDSSYGNIVRIKGFFYLDRWYLVNATKDLLQISEIDDGQDVCIIIGSNLSEDRIKSVVQNLKKGV